MPPPAEHHLIDRMERIKTTRIRWQKRFEITAVGKVWNRLRELGFIDSSLQFSAAFILSFIPFLLLVSAAVGLDLPHALVTRSDFSPSAAHDVTSLFAHGRTPITAFTVVGVILIIAGADSMTKTLQKWYEKVFAETIIGWKRTARRVLWLVGAAGYLMMQFLIGRRFGPIGGGITIAISNLPCQSSSGGGARTAFWQDRSPATPLCGRICHCYLLHHRRALCASLVILGDPLQREELRAYRCDDDDPGNVGRPRSSDSLGCRHWSGLQTTAAQSCSVMKRSLGIRT